jgi:hypothetical protein
MNPDRFLEPEDAFPTDPMDKMPAELRETLKHIERLQNPDIEWRVRSFKLSDSKTDEKIELILNDGWMLKDVIPSRDSDLAILIFGRLKQTKPESTS